MSGNKIDEYKNTESDNRRRWLNMKIEDKN